MLEVIFWKYTNARAETFKFTRHWVNLDYKNQYHIQRK